MQKTISKLPFSGTPEQEAQLKAVIAEPMITSDRTVKERGLFFAYGHPMRVPCRWSARSTDGMRTRFR